MRKVHFLFFLLIIFLTTSCAVFNKQKKQVQPVQPIEFTILQLNDVYEIAPLEGGKAGGLARVATIRKELLKENPNTITVLSGDFLSPSFLGTLKFENENGEKEKIAGLQMIESLNALGLDYVTFGNHEFDIKDPVLLEKRMAQSNFKYTVCNAKNIADGEPRPFHQKINGVQQEVPKYLIHKVTDAAGNSIKVGFLGVLLPFSFPGYVEYDPVMSTFRNTYKELKTKTDLCIGITHLFVKDDINLAKEVPGIPLFLGGHDHANMSRYVNNTIISKADANAKTVYIHRITYDPASGMTNIQSNTKKINDQIEEEEATKKVVQKWVEKGFKIMREMGYEPERKILTLTTPLHCKESAIRTEQTNYGQLTLEAIEDMIPNQDIYLINSGSMRLDDDLSNIVTEYDVLRTFPYGGAMVTMELPGDTLAKILNIGAVTNKGEGGYFQIRKSIGDDNNDPCANEQSLDPTKLYKVVLSEFTAKGKEANLELLSQYKYNKIETYTVGGQSIKNDIRNFVIQYMNKIKKR